jgi:two-component system chemotaxis response regulator CheB
LIRVLVVDDSAVFVDAVTLALESDPDLRVCGSAASAQEIVALVDELRPDVVTVDLHMPGIDGLEAVSRVMAKRPVPMLVMTADPRGHDGSLCMKAFARGAVDVVEKVDLTDELKRRRLCERVKSAAGARATPSVIFEVPRAQTRAPTAADVVVGIVASTGGPAALATVLTSLPADFPAAILVVQHLAEGFVPHFAAWLGDVSPLKVRVAVDGDRALAGVVLVAPDGGHLSLQNRSVVCVDTRAPAIDGHRPSGTTLLSSLARGHAAHQHIGVILSGMGRDGVAGLVELRAAGGGSCAQDGASSVVDGMPGAARDAGVTTALPASRIGRWLVDEVHRRGRTTAR